MSSHSEHKVRGISAFVLLCLLLATNLFSQDDSALISTISEAIRNESPTVKVSYVSLITMTEGLTVEQASQDAIKTAFQKAISYATQQFVPQERIDEVTSLVENRIYKRAKNFVVNFKSSSPQISENEYQVTIDMTIALEDLRKALIENKILQINYETKFLKLLNLTKPSQVQFVKDVLEKDLKNLSKLVETYQKRGEQTILLESSSSLAEVISVLQSAQTTSQTAETPKFSIQETTQGTLEISFQK